MCNYSRKTKDVKHKAVNSNVPKITHRWKDLVASLELKLSTNELFFPFYYFVILFFQQKVKSLVKIY